MNEDNIKKYFDKNSNYWEEFYNESKSIVDAILVERKNIIKNYIFQNHNKDVKILDLGGGSGIMSSELISLGFNVDMIDISKNMIDQAQNLYTSLNINSKINKLICNDFLNKDFNLKYDLIIALGYFEYQSDYNKNFKKIYKCLNKDGCLIFNIPIKRNLGNCFGLSRYFNYLKNFFKSNPHPGLKLKKNHELIKLVNSMGFKIDLIRDHGYGDVYFFNKIIPYNVQKKLVNFFKAIDYKNNIEFLKSNRIFFTYK